MLYAAAYIIMTKPRPDVVFCDLVSACIPILRLFIPCIIFYCHHPDQLLSQPGGYAKKLYRLPLNYLEELTTGMADKIFVNSIYTQNVFESTFKRIKKKTEVLYPSIDTDCFDKTITSSLEKVLNMRLPRDSFVILSINRYERKKNVNLAIETVAILKEFLTEEEYNKVYLIVAGGYDKRVEENVEYYLELIQLADELHVTEKIHFLRSPSDKDKISLLKHCNVLIYTPANEHFGIVPLEAMYMGKPVIAHSSGGPKESIINNKTGYLISEATAEAFAIKVAILVQDKQLAEEYGYNGKARFNSVFSYDTFSHQLFVAIGTYRRHRENKEK
ncbi:alpha-1,3/1,6-mannosyltransferase ALG2 isoform X2 [Prorops nasuta]